MKMIKMTYFDRSYFIPEIRIEDLLQKDGFKRNFKSDIDTIFGSLIYSFTRFHLYVYKRYKRELRAFNLAKWIVFKFIELLLRDLIEYNDTFKFPGREVFLSIKEMNGIKKKGIVYRPKYFGKSYRLFIKKKGNPMFCRITFKRYKAIQINGLTKPYV